MKQIINIIIKIILYKFKILQKFKTTIFNKLYYIIIINYIINIF